MVSFYGLALGNAGDYRRELLSCTVFDHLSLAVEAAGGRLYLAAEESGGCEASPADFRARVGGGQCLLLLAPAGALSAETLQRLVNQAEPACLMAGREPLALFGPADAVLGADLSALSGELAQVQTPPGEGIVVTGAESAYAVQEQLRRRINMAWMAKGVMLVDPNTTHIGPRAVLEPGCTLLPGCLIYGDSVVETESVIGPNVLLKSARIGRGCTVNASQVTESSVGAHTTVGPFAHIRPGCRVGEHVRIGDFVELKNSVIGDGTKVSHLTYIGDSDFGRGINVGCGVVTVNYDGKKKYRTTVEDDAFIGCNVNLVSPVRVGRGAYLAAGGTITEEVPEDALVVARARATVKPLWAKKRREQGKL